ncbi:hypothetical protein [Streptomyces sp. NBC_00459]|uniref:hypothetical protein n=1 Tax=Streptomyces sp. NBC_00459 TaxID=2975749 RepID=UPI002E1889EE
MTKRRATFGPRRPKVPYTAIALLAIAGGIGLLLLPLFVSFPWGSAVRLFLVLGTVAAWAAWSNRRKAYPDAHTIREQDPRPPVLFLRTFGKESVYFSRRELPSDLTRAQRARERFTEDPFEGLKTLEAFVRGELHERVGPLVALGDPTDRLPRDGAARTWVGYGVWQDEFLRQIAQARCFIAEIHDSPGLAWELTEIFGSEHRRGRLFVFTPPRGENGRASVAVSVNNRVLRQRPESWEKTVEFMGKIGYSLPTVSPGPGAVIGFGSSGEGIVLATGATTAAGFVTPIVEALAVMEAEAR